jgi:hypothetical protein
MRHVNADNVARHARRASTLLKVRHMRPSWLVVVILSLLTVAPASAQQRQVGAKAGATSASLKYTIPSEDPGFGHRLFVGGGAFFVQPLHGPLALQVEGLYMPKGAETTETQGSVDLATTLIFDYFEIPALARVSLARSTARNIYLFGGPFSAIRFNAKFRQAAGRPVTSGVTTNISSDVKAFDFGMVAGGGVDVSRHFVVDARYSWGLADINKNVPTAAHGIRTRIFAVLVGFRY